MDVGAISKTYLDGAVDDTKDNAGEPKLEGPLGDPLSSLRVKFHEFDAIGLGEEELLSRRVLS